MTAEHSIGEGDDGIRLDRWFKRHFPGFPHSLLEKQLRKGDIRVAGKKAKSSDRVQAGQMIGFRFEVLGVSKEAHSPSLKPKTYKLTPDDTHLVQSLVLYKDANIIVINKPFGLPVQGGSKIARSLDDLLDGLTFDGARPKLTHRLDRDTSGALALARNTKTATMLMRLFSGRKIEKTYWALVNGSPLPPAGKIDLPLLKKENPRASGKPGGPEGRDYEIMSVDEEGQRAITEYHVIESLARKFALVELKPLTGRTHQLRVHMQAIGCSIVGDHKYGGATDAAEALGVENKLHLHARRIVIPIPPSVPPASGGDVRGGGKTIDVTAPLPPHMKKSFEALGIEAPGK